MEEFFQLIVTWILLILSELSFTGAIAALIVFLLIRSFFKSVIRVCPPNEVLVVTGAKTVVNGKEYGFRIQKGGWTYVIPYFQDAQTLDLRILPIHVKIEGVNSANGITVGADATACVCVDDKNETLLYAAIERLIGKQREEIRQQIQSTMVGNVRGALNKTTPLQAIGMAEEPEDEVSKQLVSLPVGALEKAGEGERARFRAELLADSNQDLSAFGMTVVSVSLQKIWDTSNYIANLASKTLAKKRQEVEVQEAILRARAERAELDSKRRQTIAVNQANEKILAAQQELEVYRKECEAAIQQAKLEADWAIAKADNETKKAIQEALAELQALRNRSVRLEAETKKRAQEIQAQAQSTAISILQQTQNDLLTQKVQLIADFGDLARLVLFMQKPLVELFENYNVNAKQIKLDNLVIMDERGTNQVINRGPQAFIDFLRLLRENFGIDIKQLVSVEQKGE
ncbi:MAG: SPFH domain-containing protein [Acidobacteriota bacterium]|nr:SPFH domain-containing protein [Blastocatellia bacterium]MDW8412727.1 SPFH domain-containing protein [Acidobacteriota bacterium]